MPRRNSKVRVRNVPRAAQQHRKTSGVDQHRNDRKRQLRESKAPVAVMELERTEYDERRGLGD